jgi:hypothetical protein
MTVPLTPHASFSRSARWPPEVKLISINESSVYEVPIEYAARTREEGRS